MKKRYYKATEVEAIFAQVRKQDTDFYKAEKSATKTIVETAKRTGTYGDKTLIVMPPHYAHIPKWQRKADRLRAENIGLNYDKNRWDDPKVIYWNGKFICVDGMHRLFGVLLRNKAIEESDMTETQKAKERLDIVVELLDLSEKEAIELFLDQSNDRKRMSPADYYGASIEINKQEYIMFRDICHKFNVQIAGDDTLKNPVGVFTSINDGKNMNPDTLKKILALIAKLGWNGKETSTFAPSSAAYSTKIVRPLRQLYAMYCKDEVAMESILLKKCKGAEWFEENLYKMPQSIIFDRLHKTIYESLDARKNLSVV